MAFPSTTIGLGKPAGACRDISSSPATAELGAAHRRGWRGALPITYHLVPGPSRVHMHLAFDWKLVPARDVIARLPGSDRADQWIMRGNHHDAWVNGAADPITGQVAMLEEARAIGELA